MMMYATPPDLRPSLAEATRDDFECGTPRVSLVRYECFDPYCEYAENAHSHGTGVYARDAGW